MKKSELVKDLEMYEIVFYATMNYVITIMELSLESLENKDYKLTKELLNELLFTIEQYRTKKD